MTEDKRPAAFHMIRFMEHMLKVLDNSKGATSPSEIENIMPWGKFDLPENGRKLLKLLKEAEKEAERNNAPRQRIIEFDEECQCCNGTGLFVGSSERDGAAVVCLECKGEGVCYRVIAYKPFTCRKERDGVKRVFKGNAGISIGETEGKCTLEDFGGIPYYPNWLQGDPFPAGSEMRKFVCPYGWVQNVENKGLDWEECLLLVDTFSTCKHFPAKQACWDRYDAEMEKKNDVRD